MSERKIAIVGLGYVGLPLALAFADEFEGIIGFDVNERKIAMIRNGEDPTKEGFDEKIKKSSLVATSNPQEMAHCRIFIVAVPTPVDKYNRPDLTPLQKASETVGKVLKKGDIVCYESTVYPGVTEEFCGPILEKVSGLQQGKDFKLGYSPERVNPGDKVHTLQNVTKNVAGEDAETLEILSEMYHKVVPIGGVYRCPTIKVAEAAKVIENTQRDLNIALMNELAVIFDRMQIETAEVLKAAGTKWNFLKFTPGLVGGHCIGVDPYYLTTKAQELGYHPQVILAGRRINDDMGRFIAQKFVKLLIERGIQPKGQKVGVFGLTFKEDVSDIRNSRVPDIINELKDFGLIPVICDPLASAEETHEEYGLHLSSLSECKGLVGAVLCVSHASFLQRGSKELLQGVQEGGVVVDVKNMFPRESIPSSLHYWRL